MSRPTGTPWLRTVMLLFVLTLISAAAHTQQPSKVYRVGVGSGGPKDCAWSAPTLERGRALAKGTPWEGNLIHPLVLDLYLGLKDEGFSYVLTFRCADGSTISGWSMTHAAADSTSYWPKDSIVCRATRRTSPPCSSG